MRTRCSRSASSTVCPSTSIDVRLPVPSQPLLDEPLRGLSGLDDEVKDFVLGRRETIEILDKLDDLLVMLIPSYIREGKSY